MFFKLKLKNNHWILIRSESYWLNSTIKSIFLKKFPLKMYFINFFFLLLSLFLTISYIWWNMVVSIPLSFSSRSRQIPSAHPTPNFYCFFITKSKYNWVFKTFYIICLLLTNVYMYWFHLTPFTPSYLSPTITDFLLHLCLVFWLVQKVTVAVCIWLWNPFQIQESG